MRAARWVAAAAVVVCALGTLGCSRDQNSAVAQAPAVPNSARWVAIERAMNSSPTFLDEFAFGASGDRRGCALAPLVPPLADREDTAEVWAYCASYAAGSGPSATPTSGSSLPVVLHLAGSPDAPTVTSWEVPEDGSGYAASIERLFSPAAAESAVASTSVPPGLTERALQWALGQAPTPR